VEGWADTKIEPLCNLYVAPSRLALKTSEQRNDPSRAGASSYLSTEGGYVDRAVGPHFERANSARLQTTRQDQLRESCVISQLAPDPFVPIPVSQALLAMSGSPVI
jgi:hypothetical protein